MVDGFGDFMPLDLQIEPNNLSCLTQPELLEKAAPFRLLSRHGPLPFQRGLRDVC